MGACGAEEDEKNKNDLAAEGAAAEGEANGEGASKRERFAEGSAFLRCPAQQYAWGKIGDTSVVGQLKQHDPKFELAADKPYAEYARPSDGTEAEVWTGIGWVLTATAPLRSRVPHAWAAAAAAAALNGATG